MNWIKSFFGSKLLNEDIIVVPNFLNEKNCHELLDLLNKNSFNKAHQYENGRCNKEMFVEDPRIKSIILEKLVQFRLYGFKKVLDYHEPFEFYKYEIGEFISPHEDSSMFFESGKESNFTALIYLNDNFEGGATFFKYLNLKITPESGKLLLFKHHLVHESQTIKFGTKYIYRSNWYIN